MTWFEGARELLRPRAIRRSLTRGDAGAPAINFFPGRRAKTLHHELAWWPVFAALVIMLIGSAVTSLWLAYESVADRKKLLLTFSQFARTDLEINLKHAFSQVLDMAARWEGFLRLTNDADGQKQLLHALEPLLVHRTSDNRYDLLLFLDKQGNIFKAVNTRTADSSLHSQLEGQHYSSVLGSPNSTSLNTLFTQGAVVGLPVRQYAAVNRLLNRPTSPSTGDELPAWYQFVLAVPVLSQESASNSATEPLGAVVAVLSWLPFQQLLDDIEKKSADLDLSTGYAYLMDSDGNRTIGHKRRDPNPGGLNLYETRVIEDHNLPDLQLKLRDTPGVVHGYWFRGVRKYAALQRIAPPAPALDEALGWRLGVGVDLPDMLRAAAPSATLVFVIALLAIASVYFASHVIASRASLSVKKLTELVNAASQGQFTVVSAGGSHEELSELHDAISRLIVTLRAQVGFVPLQNPYVVGTPIRTAEMFFGRERDLEWVTEQLKAPGNELILLSGPRRIGKTSLLHSIRRLGDSIGIMPFFFDTQMLMQEISDDRSFYRVLVTDLIEQLARRHPSIAAPQLEGYSGEPLAIRKFLKYAGSRTKATPVLLFDELENLQFKVKHQQLSPEVFNLFAALLDGEVPVSLVATGSEQAERNPRGALASLFVKAVRRRLSVLAPEEAREIMVAPLKGRLAYSAGTIERVLRFTGSHPYYTQDFCHRMVTALNHLRQATVTDQIVEDVITRILDNPPPQLDFAWDQLSELNRVLLRGIASALATPDAFVDLQNAINALPPDYQEGLPRQRHRLHNALVSLIHRDWLEHAHDGYRLKVDLYRLWVRREHPPSQLHQFSWSEIQKHHAEQSVL